MLSMNVLVTDPENGGRNKYPLLIPATAEVQQACEQIWDTTNLSNQPASKVGVIGDYGLFQRDAAGTGKGRWLRPEAVLTSYQLTSQDSLEFRKKIRKLSIRLLDESKKVFIIDESLPIKDLLLTICAKIGIHDPVEYDLVREDQTDIDSTDTLTRKADAGIIFNLNPRNFPTLIRERDIKRYAKIKQKVAPDNDVRWVDEAQTLADQDVDEKDVLLLKRRYFYSDQHVDSRDPVQLNLLYVQCRDAILSGAHPVTVAQAIEFAGLQAQIEYQDFTDSKKNVDIRPMLPRSYAGTKRSDKKLLEEYRVKIHVAWMVKAGLQELDAKDKYIMLARSLKTYGVTFFLVKEKMKSKNKLTPCLFGVTKSAVLRLDDKTKETLEAWPIEQVKTWRITTNTFTLDFGDYYEGAKATYSMQTQEGNYIAQLIAGYIDLIRKRQIVKDPVGIEGETLTYDFEELPEPERKKPQIQTADSQTQRGETGQVAIPGVLRPGDSMIDSKRIRVISAAHAKVAQIIAGIAVPLRLPAFASNGEAVDDPRYTEPSEESISASRRHFDIYMGHIATSVGQIINITAASTGLQNEDDSAQAEENGQALDDTITKLISDLEMMANSLRVLSYPMDRNPNLLISAESFCRSFENLFEAVQEQEDHHGNALGRQKLLSAVSKIGETGQQLTATLVRCDSVGSNDQISGSGQSFETNLQASMSNMAGATTDLVRKAKLVASETDDHTKQYELIYAATQLAFRSADLIACAKLSRMSPKVSSQEDYQDQLLVSLDLLEQALNTLLMLCNDDLPLKNPSGQHYVRELREGTDQFHIAYLNRIRDVLTIKPEPPAPVNEPEPKNPIDEILLALNNLLRAVDQESVSTDATASAHVIPADERLTNPQNIQDHYKIPIEKAEQIAEFIREFNRNDQNVVINLDALTKFLEELLVYTVTLGRAKQLTSPEEKLCLLSYFKTVLESADGFVSEFGNRSENLDKEAFLEAVDELTALISSLQAGREILQATFSHISDSVALLDAAEDSTKTTTPNISQGLGALESLSDALAEMKMLVNNIDLNMTKNPHDLEEFTENFCGLYRTACEDWITFSASQVDLEEAFRQNVTSGLEELGETCNELLAVVVSVVGQLNETVYPKACRHVTDKISYLQLLLSSVNCGTQSCGRALSTIEEVEEELETAIIFASAGTTDLSSPDSPSFVGRVGSNKSDAFVLEKLLEKTERLLECIQRFTVATTQNELSLAVEESLRAILDLVEFVRYSTAANKLMHENSDAQILVLRALREAASSVANIIRRSKIIFSTESSEDSDSGDKSQHANAISNQVILDNASATVTKHIHYLVNAMIALSTGELQGVRLLGMTLESLQTDVESFPPVADERIDEVDELAYSQQIFHSTKQLHLAVDKANVAVKSRQQEDAVAAAGAANYAVSQLLISCQASKCDSNKSPIRAEIETRTEEFGQECVKKFIVYLTVVHKILVTSVTETVTLQQSLPMLQADVEEAVNRVLGASQPLTAASPTPPATPVRKTEQVEQETAISQELSGAAANIEKASRKLDEIRARKSIYIASEASIQTDKFSKSDATEFEFDEDILEACSAIMAASAALIPAAGAAQAELVRLGRVSANPTRYSEDKQWSQGFISAARAIGLACQTLCEAANALMLGHASEEKLISAAKQVASFTAQLLLACRVKGDTASPTMAQLLKAGYNVRRTTDNLVRLFVDRRRNPLNTNRGIRQHTMAETREQVPVSVNPRLVGGMAQEIKANALVTTKEKELSDAQRSLLLSRKAKYATRSQMKGEDSLSIASEVAAQELVLIKERELAEAKQQLFSLRQAKYGDRPAEDEYEGYGLHSAAVTVTKAVGHS